MSEERRRAPRIDIAPEARPEVALSDSNLRIVPLNLVNISRNGAGFLCKEKFEVGDGLSITLMLPGAERRIISRGTVRHREDFSGIFGYGIELGLAEEDTRALADYIVLSITKG